MRPLGGDGAGHGQDHALDPGHDVVLAHEAHLQVELRELGLAVAAQVLVAQAARDLEVAVEAADHEQLLELLGALGQRVDVARLQPRGHDEVARTLRRGLDEQRRLDLDEAGLVVDVADGLHEAAAGQDALLQRLAAQVQVAVLEAQRLVDLGLRLVDDEGRRARLGEDRDARSPAAPPRRWPAGRSPSPAGARAIVPLTRRTYSLRTAAGDRVGGGRLGRVDDDLGDAVAVAQVEEDELAEVAAAVDPAGQRGRLAGVLGAGVGAGQGAVGRLHRRPHGSRAGGLASDPGPSVARGALPHQRAPRRRSRRSRMRFQRGSMTRSKVPGWRSGAPGEAALEEAEAFPGGVDRWGRRARGRPTGRGCACRPRAGSAAGRPWPRTVRAWRPSAGSRVEAA